MTKMMDPRSIFSSISLLNYLENKKLFWFSWSHEKLLCIELVAFNCWVWHMMYIHTII